MSLVKSGNVHQHQWFGGDNLISERSSDIARFVTEGISGHEARNYSVVRLIKSLANLTDGSCLEREISQSLSHTVGHEPRTNGAWVPTMFASGLDSFTVGKGATLVPTEVGDLIGLLRARLKVAQLGATILTGLSSNVSFPVQRQRRS